MPLPGFVSLNPGYEEMKEAERRQARIFSFRTFGCGSR
jgi:hypothetical protein